MDNSTAQFVMHSLKLSSSFRSTAQLSLLCIISNLAPALGVTKFKNVIYDFMLHKSSLDVQRTCVKTCLNDLPVLLAPVSQVSYLPRGSISSEESERALEPVDQNIKLCCCPE